MRQKRLAWRSVLIALSTVSVCFVGSLTSISAALTFPLGIIGSPPPQPFTVLGKGRINGLRWDGLLFRSQGKPCTELAVGTESLPACGQASPLAVTSLTTTGRNGSEVTALSLVALSRVHSVHLIFAGRSAETLRLKALEAKSAREARVSSALHIFVRVFRGPFCLSRYVAFNKAHQKIFTSLQHPCDEQ